MNEFIYGSVGGIVGTITSHPFDTLRINIQKGNSLSLNPKWLYRGVSAPLFGIALEKTVIFGIYNKVNEKTNNKYLAGYTAGMASVFFVTPIEKYKLHYQTHGLAKPFVWSGLYRGLVPTMFREPPGYLIYFSVYDMLKSRWGEGYLKTIAYGGLAGVASWIPIYPADILKTYRQTQPEMSYRQIHREIMSKPWKYYRGFTMAVARAFPLHAGVFLGYEWAKKNIRF